MDTAEHSRARFTDTTQCEKYTCQRDTEPGRHHLVIAGDIISERPGDFVGIRSLQCLNTFRSWLGCPISRCLTTSCVGLELRPLPSPGVTRLQRYYGPLLHPSAPGLSLTGVRLIIPDHALGLPVLSALSLCICRRHSSGAADGVFLAQTCPTRISLPRKGHRVGLHIVLFEIP
jgi:hypothetical protein